MLKCFHAPFTRFKFSKAKSMNDNSVFAIFIGFGCIWVLMGVGGVIALMKMDGQEIRFSKTALVVAIPIILPIIITLTYAAIRGTF